jgi:hypothetical protein
LSYYVSIQVISYMKTLFFCKKRAIFKIPLLILYIIVLIMYVKDICKNCKNRRNMPNVSKNRPKSRRRRQPFLEESAKTRVFGKCYNQRVRLNSRGADSNRKKQAKICQTQNKAKTALAIRRYGQALSGNKG